MSDKKILDIEDGAFEGPVADAIQMLLEQAAVKDYEAASQIGRAHV